jgi:hypothetical protein
MPSAAAFVGPATTFFLYSCTVFFGIALGLCELIGRYRDAPFEAAKTPFALLYIAVNGLAAGFAYYVILVFGWTFGVSGAAVPLVQAFTAGFGAMALFRSSLLNVKIGGTDVSIGPGFAFQILLFATDREVDRILGQQRSADVAIIMRGISFALAQEALPSYCFELLQNVPIAEQQNFGQAVGALAAKPASEMTDSGKALNLGLMLMNSVGKKVLDTAVAALGPTIRGPSGLDVVTLGFLKDLDFEKIYIPLPACCLMIANFGDKQKAQIDTETVSKFAQLLKDQSEIPNAAKVFMLAIALQEIVGEAVLLAALRQLSPSANPTGPKPPPQTQSPKTTP